jgi:hypothetical protein
MHIYIIGYRTIYIYYRSIGLESLESIYIYISEKKEKKEKDMNACLCAHRIISCFATMHFH